MSDLRLQPSASDGTHIPCDDNRTGARLDAAAAGSANHIQVRAAVRLGTAGGISRRSAIKAMLAAAGAATLLAKPASVFATPSATQETLEALSDAQERYNEVQAQLDEIASQYQELSEQQDDTLTKIEGVGQQIEETQQQIDEKQQELEQKQALLSQRVAADYKSGGNDALSLLLSARTLDELISNAYYLEKLNEQDREVISEVEAIQEELQTRKADLESQKTELEQLKEQQAAQLEQMQEKQQETQELLDGLDDEVKDLIAQRDAEILAATQAEEEARRQQEEEASSSTPPVLPERGSGEDYDAASGAQKRVVNSCYYTPSPGEGYCAMWVSQVMQNAGFSRVRGNANDMYNAWCDSSNKGNLKVGMLIAVSTHSHTSAGRIYGHVGIYIGDNKVMHNVGSIGTRNLDDWISYYGTTVTPRWGWANDIDLSARD